MSYYSFQSAPVIKQPSLYSNALTMDFMSRNPSWNPDISIIPEDESLMVASGFGYFWDIPKTRSVSIYVNSDTFYYKTYNLDDKESIHLDLIEIAKNSPLMSFKVSEVVDDKENIYIYILINHPNGDHELRWKSYQTGKKMTRIITHDDFAYYLNENSGKYCDIPEGWLYLGVENKNFSVLLDEFGVKHRKLTSQIKF